ncbi:MAG: hypothetical protein ABSG64_02550 [Solirubrobacteraceae bacterium]|jgi:hypothetical protein
MRRTGAVIAVLACLLGASAGVAAARSSSVNLLAVLAAPLARAERGRVPVLVPTSMNAGFPASHLYATGGLIDGGYDIQLGAIPNCDDADACFVAEFFGGKGKLSFPARVSLSKGITGRYEDISCGASCSPASIEWIEHGDLYWIQFGAGKRALVSLADSAITAGARR